SAIIIVVPGNGVEVAHAGAFYTTPVGFRIVGFFVYGEKVVQAFDALGAELIPLVSPQKTIRHALNTGKFSVEHNELSGLVRRMDVEAAAYHLGIPLPLILGVRGAVDAYETFTAAYKTLHRSLLFFIENIARSVQENNNVILLEAAVIKAAGIFLPIQCKLVTCSKCAARGHALVDGFMVKAIGFTEYHHLELVDRLTLSRKAQTKQDAQCQY